MPHWRCPLFPSRSVQRSALPRQVAQAGATACSFPAKTPGPFPLDLTEDDFFFRQDIREDREGVKLRQRVRIVGADNCEPMANVRVNIWHCDRDGDYSGYVAMASEGLTYCRGYQMTDANGECEFGDHCPRVVPWPGDARALSGVCELPIQCGQSVDVAARCRGGGGQCPPGIVSRRAGPFVATEQDGVFADGFEFQMADLAWDEEAQEYVSFYEATVEGVGTSGVGYQELQRSEVFQLGQNFPNPVSTATEIPLDLKQPGEVFWALWSAEGQCVHFVDLGREAGRAAGDSRGFHIAWIASGFLPLSRRSGDRSRPFHGCEAHDACEMRVA